jgi:hypothetical protein
MAEQGYQWQVTAYGLETRPGQEAYAIAAADLFTTCTYEGETLLSALIVLLGRGWVIRDDILDIFPKALAHHARRQGRVVDPALLARSLDFYRENDTWLKARAVKAKVRAGGTGNGE